MHLQTSNERVNYALSKLMDIIDGTDYVGHIYAVGALVRCAMLGEEYKKNEIELVTDFKYGPKNVADYVTTVSECYNAVQNPKTYGKDYKTTFRFLADSNCNDVTITIVRAYGKIENDFSDRDFTIDSLYYNLSDKKVYDFSCHGINDCFSKTLRCCVDPALSFLCDPIRMMRVLRLSIELGYGIERETWFGLMRCVKKINTAMVDELREEIERIMVMPKPSLVINKMLGCGLFEYVFQDVYDLKGYDQLRGTSYLKHSIECMDMVSPLVTHRLSALYHEIGRVIAKKGENISSISADLSRIVFKEFEFDDDTTQEMVTAIRYHSYFSSFDTNALPSDSKIRRFMRHTEDFLAPTVDLMHANNVCVINVRPKKVTQALNILNKIEEIRKKDEEQGIKLPISGDDIVKVLKVKKGPAVGFLLEKVKEKFKEDDSLTREECLAYAKNFIKKLTT